MTDYRVLTLDELNTAYEDAHGSPMILARISYDIRELRALLADLDSLVRADLGKAMPEKYLEVPGIGVFEKHKGVKRSAWRYDELIPAVSARIADDPTVRFDPDTGDQLPPAEMVRRVIARFVERVSLNGGKVKTLRADGLQVDEYCREEPEGITVELPARPEPPVLGGGQ